MYKIYKKSIVEQQNEKIEGPYLGKLSQMWKNEVQKKFSFLLNLVKICFF